MSILLFLAGGLNSYSPGTITPTGTLTKEVTHSFSGTITGSGIRWNNVYEIPSVSGTLTPSGALTRLVRKIAAGTIAPTGVHVGRGGGMATWQTDMNVGLTLVGSQGATYQIDEDVLVFTAAAVAAGLLQTDEDMRAKAPIPVTSY